MAAARESYALTPEEQFSILVELASEISREDEADESVGASDVEQASTNPITKLETIRKLVTQGSEMPHGVDENGRGNRQVNDKMAAEQASGDAKKVRRIDNTSVAEAAHGLDAFTAAKSKLASIDTPADTEDVDELKLAHRENLRLASVLSCLASAAEIPTNLAELSQQLVEKVLSGEYLENDEDDED